MKKNLPKIIALVFWMVLLGGLYWYKSALGLRTIDIFRQLYFLMSGTYFGPLLFIVAYCLRSFTFFPSTFFAVLAGAVFGFLEGLLYTLFGGTLSALVAYFLARYFSKDFIHESGNQYFIKSWRKELKNNAFFTVLILRLLYLPFDLINFGCGLLNVGWRPFALATFLAMVVDTGGFISVGASIKNVQSFKFSELQVDPHQFQISLLLIFVSLLFAVAAHYYRKYQNETSLDQ